jgi:hypothetical protein
MRKKLIGKLRRARESSAMVRVERAHRYSDRLDGFVVSVGKKWAVLAKTMDGGYFDGYVAFRLADMTEVSREHGFEPRFSRRQPLWPVVLDQEFDLDSTAGVLRSLASLSPLIAVEKERERPAMWIGEIEEIDAECVWLLEVRRKATWHKRSRGYRLRAITAVSIETHYLTALAAVAGRATALGSDRAAAD